MNKKTKKPTPHVELDTEVIADLAVERDSDLAGIAGGASASRTMIAKVGGVQAC